MNALRKLLNTQILHLTERNRETLNDVLDENLNCWLVDVTCGRRRLWELRVFSPELDGRYSERRPVASNLTVEDIIKLACRLKREGETHWAPAA